MQFKEIELVRVSIFPVDGCRDRIASYAFQDDGSGHLTLIPKFNFGGQHPHIRTLALDALQGLFGILVPSNGSLLYNWRSNPPVRAQLDIKLTISVEEESRTIPVQISYGMGNKEALIPPCKTFAEDVAIENIATICVQPLSTGDDAAGTNEPVRTIHSGGDDSGTNEAGKRIREVFRRVDRIRGPVPNWAAGMNFGLPKIIRIRSASDGERRARPNSRFQTAVDISSIGAGGDELISRVLRHFAMREGEAGLRQLEKGLHASQIFPESSGRTFDLVHQPPGIRQNGIFLHPLHHLGSYELPIFKILAYLHVLTSCNSIVILDGLDRVLDDAGLQRVTTFVRNLGQDRNIKLIISERGATWSYRAKGYADTPKEFTRPLQHASPREMHPQNLLSKLTIYVEGKYDKLIYDTMLGDELSRNIDLINPHEDIEFTNTDIYEKSVKRSRNRAGGVDGYQMVIDAVQFRRARHGDFGKYAFMGICDGDAACVHGEMRTLLNAGPGLFSLQHKGLAENILFVPYHTVENIMLVDGRALEFIQLSRRPHQRCDLVPGAMSSTAMSENNFEHDHAGSRVRNSDVTDKDIDEAFKDALQKFRSMQGLGSIDHLSVDQQKTAIKKWKMEQIDVNGVNFSNLQIYKDFGLDKTAYTEGRMHLRSAKLRLCNGKSLLGLAKKKIGQPQNWEQGLKPFLASSAFASILKNTVKVRLNKLHDYIDDGAAKVNHSQRLS